MTAVTWLLDNLISEPYSEADFEHNKECWNKAEEMEKQQIIEAHGNKLKKSSGVTNYEYWFSGEEYYNKKFK